MNEWDTWHVKGTTVQDWYGICVGGVLLAGLLYRLVAKAIRWGTVKTTVFFLKHIRYRRSPRILQCCDAETLAVTVLAAVYVAINALWIALGTNSAEGIGQRAGALAFFNLLPLLAGTRFGVSADMLGISLRTYQRVHRWIGRTSAAEVVVHGSILLVRHSSTMFTTPVRAATYLPFLVSPSSSL
jgi:hypothetical protein